MGEKMRTWGAVVAKKEERRREGRVQRLRLQPFRKIIVDDEEPGDQRE